MNDKISRNIVLILGNGFDLDLGLKTSYKDFWESDFCPIDYPAPLIHHLNKRWNNDMEAVRWYDLENELLEYYKSIPDPKVGADILTEEEKSLLLNFKAYGSAYGLYNDELIASLIEKGVLNYDGNATGIIKEHYKGDALQSPIWRDQNALQLIKKGLCEYLKSISKPSLDTIITRAACHVFSALSKSIKTTGSNVSIYTFNYTPIPFIVDLMPSVNHVHGSCDDGNVIVGTRDDQNMDPNYDFLQKAMDDNFSPPDIVTALKEADEVIIFGHSLGENDRQYFAPFFLNQSDYYNQSRKEITIFTRDSNSKKEIKRALQKMTNGHLSALHITYIRTANLYEDQQLMYDFLVNHEDGDTAERAMGILCPST